MVPEGSGVRRSDDSQTIIFFSTVSKWIFYFIAWDKASICQVVSVIREISKRYGGKLPNN